MENDLIYQYKWHAYKKLSLKQNETTYSTISILQAPQSSTIFVIDSFPHYQRRLMRRRETLQEQ